MHRIDGPGATIDEMFTEGNPISAVPATEVTADWLNDLQENVCYAIEQAGITLVKGDKTQLHAAIIALAIGNVGEIKAFGFSTAPDGYLKCNGAAVSRTTYSELFTAIGTTFGAGDGSTTFNVPDLRGEFVRGWDDGRGVDAARVFGSAQADQLKAHAHSMMFEAFSEAAGGTSNLNGFCVGQNDTSLGSHTNPVAVQSSGGAEGRPRNVAMLYCIKY